MTYTKNELHQTLIAILSPNAVDALGTTRAVEEAAIQLFLNDAPHNRDTEIIRKALSDLRDLGSFRYADTSK